MCGLSLLTQYSGKARFAGQVHPLIGEHGNNACSEFAAEFLNAASEDDDPKTYLNALRKVVEARGGMASVAGNAELSRETLYQTLSARGKP